MRGIVVKVLAFLAIGVAVAGCQSPGNVVGALQPMAYGSDILDASAGTMPPSTPMPTGLQAAAIPDGFISFCLRFRDQCTTSSDGVSRVTVTPVTWRILNRVNDRMNEDIVPESDLENYGRPEYWTIPTDGYGDCEDYALAKRQALIAAGLPELALRIAVVITPDGSRHAVLTVSTDRGDYVLDNMRTTIMPWTATGYRWIERQAANNPWNWVALQSDGVAAPMAVAENHPAAPALRPDLDKIAFPDMQAQLNRAAPDMIAMVDPTPQLRP